MEGNIHLRLMQFKAVCSIMTLIWLAKDCEYFLTVCNYPDDFISNCERKNYGKNSNLAYTGLKIFWPCPLLTLWLSVDTGWILVTPGYTLCSDWTLVKAAWMSLFPNAFSFLMKEGVRRKSSGGFSAFSYSSWSFMRSSSSRYTMQIARIVK